MVTEEGDGCGVIVQFIQAEIELLHDMGYDVHDQVRIDCYKDTVQASSDTIIVEILKIIGPHVEEFGSEVSRPLRDAIHGLSGDEQILEDHQHDARRVDLGSIVFGWQVMCEKFLQSHSLENSIDDRNRLDTMGDDGLSVARISSLSIAERTGSLRFGLHACRFRFFGHVSSLAKRFRSDRDAGKLELRKCPVESARDAQVDL